MTLTTVFHAPNRHELFCIQLEPYHVTQITMHSAINCAKVDLGLVVLRCLLEFWQQTHARRAPLGAEKKSQINVINRVCKKKNTHTQQADIAVREEKLLTYNRNPLAKRLLNI